MSKKSNGDYRVQPLDYYFLVCDDVMRNIIDNFEEVSKEEPSKEETPEEYTAVSYAEKELHC